MAILPIVEVPDPRLRQISSPVETVDDEVRALVADMFETMYAAPGIGLAAIQVGVPRRILVIDLQEPADPEDPESKPVRDPRVFINPEIVEHSDQEVPYTEGCLSVPDQYAEVDRPDRIRARWLDLGGKAHDEEIEGLLATCLQHEMDHLEGVRPEDLSIDKLVGRVSSGGIEEVVLAMNATLEGQTTAHYLAERLENFPIRLSQLAHGLPVGGELDYLDEGTLAQALRARRPIS